MNHDHVMSCSEIPGNPVLEATVTCTRGLHWPEAADLGRA